VGQIVGDQSAFCVQCSCGNEQIGICNELPASVQFPIQGRSTFDDLLGKGKNQTNLAEGGKCNFVGMRLFGFESARISYWMIMENVSLWCSAR